MPLTMLDPRSALIVIDLQYGLVALPMAHPIAAVIARCAALADAFRRRGLPVVLVNTDGAAPGRREQNAVGTERPPGWSDLVPELGARSHDHRVTKRSPGAFTATGLEAYLHAGGITQVVIGGIATGTGVETSARQAYELGFNVALAIDAMSDMDAMVHANSATRIFPRIGETGTVDEIVRLLAGSDGGSAPVLPD